MDRGAEGQFVNPAPIFSTSAMLSDESRRDAKRVQFADMVGRMKDYQLEGEAMYGGWHGTVAQLELDRREALSC